MTLRLRASEPMPHVSEGYSQKLGAPNSTLAQGMGLTESEAFQARKMGTCMF